MRPVALLCIIAFIAAGFYLFQTKNQAMLLDRDIARILKSADSARERATLLRAEYARLTGPGPVGDLAERFLPDLRPTAPPQYAAHAARAT